MIDIKAIKAALAAAAQRKKDKLRKRSNITVEDFE